MVGHIAFEMQQLSFWGWGDIQEGIGCEHLEFKRAVWARERTESSVKGLWSCAHQEKTASVVKSTHRFLTVGVQLHFIAVRL